MIFFGLKILYPEFIPASLLGFIGIILCFRIAKSWDKKNDGYE